MANTVATLLQMPGAVNSSGDTTALFLKKYAGEVLTAFAEVNKLLSRTMVRTITKGKSAQFPTTGKATAAYYTLGRDILDNSNGLLSQVNSNERVISIDAPLISASLIPSIMEAIEHYDVRSIYSTESGNVLANRLDKMLALGLLLASRETTPNVTGGPVGGKVTSQSMNTAATIVSSLYQVAANFDAADVPSADRFVGLPPWAYYKLAARTDLVDRDFAEPGSNGRLADATVYRCNGFEIVKSNHFPNSYQNPNNGGAANTPMYDVLGQLSTTATGASGGPTAENVMGKTVLGSGSVNVYGNGGNTNGLLVTEFVGQCWQRGAIGTTKLLDLSLESEYKIERQGTLMVAKYAMGHGILRPECSWSLEYA